MSVNLSPVGGAGAQFCDNNGNPLNGGKLYTYSAGTTTPVATYTSAAGSVFHTNPIVLNAGGRVPDSGEIWLSDNISYKFVLKTSADVLIATWDNINGINSNFVNYTVQEEVITATAGQTVFNLSTITYAPATNSLAVYIDGVNQIVTDSYIETDTNTVTFVSGLHDGALVKFTTAVPATGTATDASVVSYIPPFTGGVATTVEAKLAQTVSVKDFGAVGDGVTDDTAAIQAAIDGIADGATLFFPVGDYVVSNLTIDKPLVLVGDGVAAMAASGAGTYLAGVRITSKSGTTGYLFNVSAGTVTNSEGHNFGVQFRNIYLFGRNRGDDVGGVKIQDTDHFVFEDVFAESFQREAINFYSSCREGSVQRLRTRFCGTRNTSGTSYPAIGLVETSASDPSNNIRFIDCGLVYSMGDTVLVDVTNKLATNQVRKIHFLDCFFHGIFTSIDSVPYTFTADEKALTHLNNKGGDVQVENCNFLFAGDNKPHIYSGTSTAASQTPITHVYGSTFVNHYSLTSLGYGIQAVSGTLFTDNNTIQTCATASVDIGAAVSYQVGQDYLGVGTTNYAINASATNLDYVGSFTPTLIGSGGGTATYTRQTGRITRHGNVATFSCELVVSGLGTLAGNISIGTLPLSMLTASLQVAYSVYADGCAAGVANIMARTTSTSANTIELSKFATGANAHLAVTDLTSAFKISVTGTFIVQ